MEDNEYKRPFIIIGILVMLLIAVSVIWFLPDFLDNSGSSDDSPVITPPAVTTSTPAPTLPPIAGSIHGMILSIDHDAKTFTMTNLETGEEKSLFYAGHTDVLTAYGKRISAKLLKPGDFVNVAYDTFGCAVTLQGSNRIWTYRNVFNLTIDNSIGRISIGEHVYHFDDRLKVMQGESFLSVSDLSRLDVFDVYGVDDYVYLIKIACGHGFLTLDHIDDYVGGTLYINGDVYCQITSELQPITLSEGDYTVSVENKKLSGSADVRISCFETTTFDLAPYSAVPVSTGSVSFRITPRDAFLYIDGIRTTFTEPVSVTYGTHAIEVSLGGYKTFKGTLTVDRPSMSYAVSLPSTSGSGDDLYTDEPDDEIKTVTYKMTVYCDEDCSVYVDDVYKGTIDNGSLTFNRPERTSITIRFELSGYESASYAITIEEDDTDMQIRFPAMVPIK